jgi:hypothetical protein
MTLLTEHRRNLDNLTTIAIADTVGALRLLEDEPFNVFAYEAGQILSPVATAYSSVASALAVNYYDQSRARARQVNTRYEAAPIEVDVDPVIQSAIAYGTAQAKKGSSFSAVTSMIAGSMQRIVNAGDRETIQFNIVTDPDGTKYQRVASASACAFCRTMAAVAEVQDDQYYNKYHNYCKCTSLPIFTGQTPLREPWYDQAERQYETGRAELLERQREARRAFDRQLAADGLPTGGRAATTAFRRSYPELSLTTKNILKEVRKQTGLP